MLPDISLPFLERFTNGKCGCGMREGSRVGDVRLDSWQTHSGGSEVSGGQRSEVSGESEVDGGQRSVGLRSMGEGGTAGAWLVGVGMNRMTQTERMRD